MKRQSGYSFLESILALSLALLLSTFLFNIYIQCKKSNLTLHQFNDLNAKLQLAFRYLRNDIHMAGLIGCVRLAEFSPLSSQLTPFTRILVGKQAKKALPIKIYNLLRVKKDSDIILLQFLNPHTVPVNFAYKKTIDLGSSSSFHTDDKLLISDCQHAELINWGHSHLRYIYNKESEIGFFNSILYYIASTGRYTNDGKAIYALYRRNLYQSLRNSAELIEGIDSMKVELGIENSAGNIIYQSSEKITDQSLISSLKIALVFNATLIPESLRHCEYIITLREP